MADFLSREEIGEALSRHKGARARLAAELEVTRAAITLWCNGSSNSLRIAVAAERAARKLLTLEGACGRDTQK